MGDVLVRKVLGFPQLHKQLQIVACAIISVLEDGDRRIPAWLVSLGEAASSRFSERPCLRT